MSSWLKRRRKRSPLTAKPLRVPGQSVDARRREVIESHLLLPMIFAVILLCFAGMEWWWYLYPRRPSPYIVSAFAILALAYAIYRFIRAFPEIRNLGLARDGERAVGQYLEALRIDGYIVMHDLPGEGFNVDHVLIGPAGVMTIETKTFSKRGDSRVRFDGVSLYVDGWKPDRDPIVQARAQARWLSGILLESTGRRFEVWPVILFPGWFVESTPAAHNSIWVLNPKAFKTFLENEPVALAPEDVKLAGFHLSRYVRASEDS